MRIRMSGAVQGTSDYCSRLGGRNPLSGLPGEAGRSFDPVIAGVIDCEFAHESGTRPRRDVFLGVLQVIESGW